jgi:hypothetical protein
VERHVLTATTYSKSVLRVAAEMVTQRRTDVAYMPSYEIITGAYNRGAYYADDLRNVTERGVDHVMKMFLRSFTLAHQVLPVQLAHVEPARPSPVDEVIQAMCDEERLGGTTADS